MAKLSRAGLERKVVTEKGERPYRVGVFPVEGSRQLSAYTTWYNAAWEGCCEHTVTAMSGTEAKRRAMQAYREQCQTRSP